MFGSIKKAMAAGAVVAVGALAGPAMASADQWTTDGSTPFAGPAVANGVLTINNASGLRTTCDVAANLNLSNSGSAADGEVTHVDFGAAAGGVCSTTAPGCTVTIAAIGPALPWTISTSGTGVTVHNVALQYGYTGTSCVLHGASIVASGSLSGTAAGDTIAFSKAGPLTTTMGPATVDGSLIVTDAGGNPVDLF